MESPPVLLGGRRHRKGCCFLGMLQFIGGTLQCHVVACRFKICSNWLSLLKRISEGFLCNVESETGKNEERKDIPCL